MSYDLPSYAELPVTSDAPRGSSWGVWGEHDVFGALNLLDDAQVRKAVGSVRTGRVFPLDLDLRLPDPPMFGRTGPRHEIVTRPTGSNDDVIREWNTQASSQWDGFRHYGHAEHGHYAGLGGDEHGVLRWAERGIVARGVLADVDAWRAATGRPIRHGEPDPITVDDLTGCLRDQGTPVELGDVLLVRTGWTTWYLAQRLDARPTGADAPCPGLDPHEETAAYLWDLHIAAVAADNPALELWPADRGGHFLHPRLLSLLGIPIGELWFLDDLARDCAATGTYDAMLTSSPLHLDGGAASPPNALAIR